MVAGWWRRCAVAAARVRVLVLTFSSHYTRVQLVYGMLHAIGCKCMVPISIKMQISYICCARVCLCCAVCVCGARVDGPQIMQSALRAPAHTNQFHKWSRQCVHARCHNTHIRGSCKRCCNTAPSGGTSTHTHTGTAVTLARSTVIENARDTDQPFPVQRAQLI